MFSQPFLHRQRSITVAACAAWLLSAAGAAAQVGLGLTPMREELKLSAGGQHSGILNLTNDSHAKVRVTADVLDFYIDAAASPQFGRQWAQEAEYSCRQWLVLNPMEMELEGDAHILVRYTLRVPPDAGERSYHCAIGFTTQPTADQAKVTGLRTAVQIVSAIYVVVGRPALEGAIKDLKLEYVNDPKQQGFRAVVVISNPGLMHFRPSGELEVLNEAGVLVETAPFVPMPVLPKRDQNFLFPLKLEGGPGKYTLRARVDLGANEIQEATAIVVAKKPQP